MYDLTIRPDPFDIMTPNSMLFRSKPNARPPLRVHRESGPIVVPHYLIRLLQGPRRCGSVGGTCRILPNRRYWSRCLIVSRLPGRVRRQGDGVSHAITHRTSRAVRPNTIVPDRDDSPDGLVIVFPPDLLTGQNRKDEVDQSWYVSLSGFGSGVVKSAAYKRTVVRMTITIPM